MHGLTIDAESLPRSNFSARVCAWLAWAPQAFKHALTTSSSYIPCSAAMYLRAHWNHSCHLSSSRIPALTYQHATLHPDVKTQLERPYHFHLPLIPRACWGLCQQRTIFTAWTTRCCTMHLSLQARPNNISVCLNTAIATLVWLLGFTDL